jgi:PLD-like domain
MQNLNNLEIFGLQNPSLQDFSGSKTNVSVQVYFKDIESHLIQHIESADVVVGCVAWLTSPAILAALSKKSGVSIIVQKEDWLRPDLDDRENWKERHKSRYDLLSSSLTRLDLGLRDTVLRDMSYCHDPTIEAVRCVGNHNSKKAPAFPRMHHKFIVLCREVAVKDNEYRNYDPYEVWTGSFNFTKNAASSFENAVVLRDATLAKAFLGEYAQVAALSEQLNWESEWIEPQWQAGS